MEIVMKRSLEAAWSLLFFMFEVHMLLKSVMSLVKYFILLIINGVIVP